MGTASRFALVVFIFAVGVAAALRLPSLALRPMHADEAVHADKFGSLLEGRGYTYDRTEFHGPSLYYLTLPSAWLRGERTYGQIDEVTLRIVPALLGIVLVALHLAAAPLVGRWAAAWAALLAAVSPAFVYYNRYFVHETPLVLFTFGALLGLGWYARRPGPLPAIVTGACLGLMQATKETAPLAMLAMLVALGLTLLTERRASVRALRVRDLALAAGAAAGVAALLYSSFLTHPRGLVDAVGTYGVWVQRARAETLHVHPWDFYLRLLVHFPAQGTPFWTEAPILVLAACGCVAAWRALPGCDPRPARFVAFYTIALTLLYSAIPYKTPWCLLGFHHGMILLAGVGAAFVVRYLRSPAVALVLCVAGHLGWQAWAGSLRFPADPRNPYVYAHTGTDIFSITERVAGLARAHPDGLAMPIEIVSRTNLWPLPFYLRRYSGTAWWTGVPPTPPDAPLVLATPDMQTALVTRFYELPPPGQRELRVGIFERPVELRPGVELRGYATASLFERYRQTADEPTGADTPAAGPKVAVP